jgi:glutathione S-transferase
MDIVLYHLAGTRSQRIRWMLEELGLEYELRTIDLFAGEGDSAEYRAISPLGQLPAVTIDGAPMLESGAIVQWLAEYHIDQGFAPALDSPQRRAFDQWMYFSVSNLEMPAWEIVLHGKILPDEVAVKAIIPFATRKLLEVLSMLENALGDQDYLIDNNFSAVDIMIGYILMWHPDHIEGFHALKAYTERLRQRPAYIRSRED